MFIILAVSIFVQSTQFGRHLELGLIMISVLLLRLVHFMLVHFTGIKCLVEQVVHLVQHLQRVHRRARRSSFFALLSHLLHLHLFAFLVIN